MGRSQETFGKKEKEKKKIEKRKLKEEKKEERKANSSSGKGLDDMLAYVDENGNLVDAPPDPKKKKVINIEDIQVSTLKEEDREPEELVRTGIVAFFNEAKGYGFIKDIKTQESFFVHINSLTEPLKENNKVTFELEMGPKGPNAVRVKKAIDKIVEKAPKVDPKATIKENTTEENTTENTEAPTAE
jgi:cold shock CspA family protein